MVTACAILPDAGGADGPPTAVCAFRRRLADRGAPDRHARYFILQLTESYLTPRLFLQILGRIERVAWHPT
jgi:hypothetical protein